MEQTKKTSSLHVVVVEAKDLAGGETEGLIDPYCMLSIVTNKQQSKNGTKTSPKTSPKGSPKARTKFPHQGSEDCNDLQKTQTIKGTVNPKWNEAFNLEVRDTSTEEVHIYIWNHGGNGTERHSGLKGLFKHIWQNIDTDKCDDDFIGMVCVHLKDIPSGSCDMWYDIQRSRTKQGNKKYGRCRIKLDLTIQPDEVDAAESEQCSIDDYYDIVKKLYQYHVSNKKEEDFDLHLSAQNQRMLDQFAAQNNITQVTQAIINLVIMMRWTVNDTMENFSEKTINEALDTLQAALVKQDDATSVTQQELDMFEEFGQTYFKYYLQQHQETPALFPWTNAVEDDFRTDLMIPLKLLQCNLWKNKTALENRLSGYVYEQVQIHTRTWIIEKLASIHSNVKDSVIPDAALLSSTVMVVKTQLMNSYPAGITFFNSFGVDYLRAVIFALESKIASKAQELMIQMDKYTRRYQKYPVNILKSSKTSLQLYMNLKELCDFVKNNIRGRDFFKISLTKYQSWFNESLVFWLQTFKTECRKRMDKALEIDKDFVTVTSLVKYSNSSVDVLACFEKMIAEWNSIGFTDSDSVHMGVTKVTDVVCDGARLYADKIGYILEKNGFYDSNTRQFDVTDRLCITINNIEHIRQYLQQLPTLLKWQEVASNMATQHESEEIGNQTEKTLSRLVKTADTDIHMKSTLLLHKVAECLSTGMRRYIAEFTVSGSGGDENENTGLNQSPKMFSNHKISRAALQKLRQKQNATEPLVNYIDSNLQTLYDKLMTSIYPCMISAVWMAMLRCFSEKVLLGQPPVYYSTLQQHLSGLKSYFIKGGIKNFDTHEYRALVNMLTVNAKETPELVLMYYASMADEMSTPIDYYGHLAVKLSYMEETNDSGTVFVNVINATNLPGLDPTGLSDPYVIIELRPSTVFHSEKVHKTRVVQRDLNPVYNETFQLHGVSKDLLSQRGAVLVFTIMDHDAIGADDFAGEVVLHLSSVPVIDPRQNVDDTPVVMLPVKRPGKTHETHEILKDRSSWDKVAKSFISHRRRAIENQPQRTDKDVKKTDSFASLFKFFTKRSVQNMETKDL